MFVLSYRANGRKNVMALDAYGILKIDQAREKAKNLLVCVDRGADPIQNKRKAAIDQRVKGLNDFYMERHAKLIKRLGYR